jgi:hypothetical protein
MLTSRLSARCPATSLHTQHVSPPLPSTPYTDDQVPPRENLKRFASQFNSSLQHKSRLHDFAQMQGRPQNCLKGPTPCGLKTSELSELINPDRMIGAGAESESNVSWATNVPMLWQEPSKVSNRSSPHLIVPISSFKHWNLSADRFC